MTIHCIMNARITKYTDNHSTVARVQWLDNLNHPGETVGAPRGKHMQDLLLRALREGVTIVREEF